MIVYSHNYDDSITQYEIQDGFAAPDIDTRSRSSKHDYKAVIAARGNASYPYTRETLTRRSASGFAVQTIFKNPGVKRKWASSSGLIPHSGHYTQPSISSYASDISALKNRCLVKVANKFGESFENISAPTFAGELLETLRMVKSPLKSMRQHFAKGFKTSQGLKGSAKSASDFWLEWNFGWVPLAVDLQAILEERKTLISNQRLFGSEKIKLSPSYLSRNGFDSFFFDQYSVSSGELSVRLTLGADLRHDAPSLEMLNYGLTFDELPIVAWELLPWSFVVDYFADVGKYLSAQKYLRLMDMRYGSFATKIELHTKYGYRPINDSNYLTTIDKPECGTHDWFYFNREPIITLPSITADGIISPSTTLKQKINLLALGVGRVKL